jgi:hypothetical protein
MINWCCGYRVNNNVEALQLNEAALYESAHLRFQVVQKNCHCPTQIITPIPDVNPIMTGAGMNFMI